MMEGNNQINCNNNNSSNSNRVPLMDDGELEFSNQELLSSANIGEIPSSGSMDSFFDELLRDTHACTHTHTCNPPGPDLSHTHTCFHVHTKILPPSSEEKSGNNDDSAESGEQKSRKRGRERGGNREAVRKYRQKKKAHAASLEDEVVKLRALNQQLLKRLQGQAALEAEIARLKCLLVDIRGRIEGEIGSFPYQRPVKSGDMYQNIANNNNFPGSYMIPCNAQCGDQIYCLHPGVDGKAGEGANIDAQCEYENCMASLGSAPKDLLSCGTTNITSTGGSSGNARRKS
ncbi:basic leucine zipper 23-like isoform X2 [Chenopodium quinoa]|uniref:basic leucine zipper 23-like isoform X2 n=1 Tax=Chenopodium quinoa TaxID=63459 RepID=UPI000B76F016|nr:basic leucine zipper 23-like isoform X2 [Chenopodium quinoa]